MRVGIDAQALTSPAWNHGIGRLTAGFVTALSKYDLHNEYFLVRPRGKELPFASPFEVVDVPFETKDTMTLESNFEYGKSLASIVRRLGIDVYHITTPVTSFTHFPVLTDCAVVTTFYDLVPFKMRYYPSHYSSQVYADYLQKILLTKRFATRFAAISNWTKKDLVDELKIWPSRINVAYPALDISLMTKDRSSVRPEKPFLLYVGGGDPRKNLEFLIRAFSCLSKNLLSEYDLVIDVEQENALKLRQQATSLGILENVKFLKYPDDKKLVSLYQNCTALVLPSLYEGFGLPLLEAMAFSKPILASNCTSIPEVVGDAALLFDPQDLKDATEKMTIVLTDERVQSDLSRKSSERLSKFSWENSASELKKTYASAVDDKRKFRSKQRIAYFSPLYPTQSGISHYSSELLKELTKKVDIDVFAEDPKAASLTGEYKVRLRNASEFESYHSEYGLAIYQVGNSTYHSWMLGMLTNFPGVIVLHDFNLHNFLLHHALESNDQLGYSSAMAFQYGEEGVLVAEQQLRGPRAEYVQQYPLNIGILLFAESVISVGKKITQSLTQSVNPSVSIVPIGANVYDQAYLKTKRNQSRSLLNLSSSDLVFFIGGLIEREEYHQKRLSLCLKLFERVLDVRKSSKLIICGIIDDYVLAQLRDEVSTLGLNGQVILRRCQDFPKDIDLCAHASDVSINLRRDANALGSGSTVMHLSMGIPVLASNNELYHEFPDDCVWKVDEGMEEEMLDEYMKYLATSPEILQVMTGKALKFIQGRSWSKIAESYVDLIRKQGASFRQ